MTMAETAWSGMAVSSPQNIVWEDAYDAMSCPFVLPEAQVRMDITLPQTTNRVALFAPLSIIWVSFDTKLPGPIPDPVGGAVVGADVFRPGAILYPGHAMSYILQDTGGTHVLHLLSRDAYAQCDVTAFIEWTPY
jgi:hypothetical protein